MVAATSMRCLGDPKHLGAEPGFLMVLHTWSRQLKFHPHIHCIVTGGGLSADYKIWAPIRTKYLFPVKVLSPVFRAKFLDEMERLVAKDELFLDPSHRVALAPKIW